MMKVARSFILAMALTGAANVWGQERGVTEVELQNFQTSLELVQLDLGQYVTLEDLNDLPPGSNPNETYDDIDNGGVGTYVLELSTGRFRATPRDLPPGAWNGPYASFQPGRFDDVPPYPYGEGAPLDLWGTPYHLYSPLGLVDPISHTINTTDPLADDFDRWALVSAGPDTLFDTGDDVIRTFGGAPNVPVVASVTLAPGSSIVGSPRAEIFGPFVGGQTIRIRGYNFGSTQGTSRVLLDTMDLGSAAAWNSQEIDIVLPYHAAGATLRLEIGGVVRDTVAVAIISPAGDWNLYE